MVDEFARVFHAVHGETGSLHCRNSEHAVPVVGIRQAYAGDEPREDPTAYEDDLAEEGHVGVGFYYETRAENHVERRIAFERLHEIGHVVGVVLAVGVEGGNEIDTESAGVAAKEFQTGLESGASSAVLRMADGHHVASAGEDGRGAVAGAVVHHEDIGKSRGLEGVDDAFEPGCLVIGAYEEGDVVIGWVRTVARSLAAPCRKREFGSLGSAHVEGHFTDEPGSVFAVLLGLIEKEERKVRKENDTAVDQDVRASRNAENASDEVERLGDVREKQEPAADSEKHEEMQRVELLPLRNVERDDEDDDARYGEKNLEEVHF